MGELDFGTVYGSHAQYVRRALQRFGVTGADVDDAAQDAFVTIHRLLSGFEGRAKVETWIHAICWRVAAGYRRRARRARAHPTLEPIATMPLELAPTAELHASLDALEPSDRDLLVLHEVGEMSLFALSDLTGRSRDVVRRRIEHARAALVRSMNRDPNSSADLQLLQAAPTRHAVDEQALAQLALGAGEHEYLCADYTFSRLGHMVLSRWRGVYDRKSMAICAKVTVAAAANAPDGFSYCSVIDPSALPPDHDARQLSAWLMSEVAHRLNAVAFVATSPELRELVPQIANSYAFLSGSQVNVRHFDDLPEALAWIALQTPGASLPAMLDHCEHMRLRMDALSAAGPEQA